ncbi:hypothetical protein DXG01_001568 [Tephrocybe rancida]|nr:hypothetical protein DXG01_001568 [Tephrocybe rancida]
MLISTQLDTLGDLLRTDKATMITKGVASVRSPVCNLRQFSRDITHDSFTNAVIDEFRKEYNISTLALQAQVVDETDDLKKIDYIQKGMEELPSWDWAYGQTPEFTYTAQRAFLWGSVVAEIHSKHGIINRCTFQVLESHLYEPDVQDVTELGQVLEGQRYGFLDSLLGSREEPGPRRDVLTWIDGIAYT